MAKPKKPTPGQKLWLALYRATSYDQEANKIAVPLGSPRANPQRATRRWLDGTSRHLKETFATGLRQLREELGLTQKQVADIAELTVTAVAMIERGERAPNLDTAARLCWTLDYAAGVTLDDFASCAKTKNGGGQHEREHLPRNTGRNRQAETFASQPPS